MPSLVSVAAVVLTFLVTAHAEPTLAGKWQGETDGGASIVLTLTVKGTALSGTMVRDGASADLLEGKVSGAAFSFKTTLNDRTETLSGELVNDQIRIWLERQGPSKAIVLNRVRPESGR
jgi:hypothetical protein